MVIKCKASGRFLADINIEDYYKGLQKMGVEIKVPIVLKFACPKCKMIEEYEVYPSKIVHTKSYKRALEKK